MENLKELKERIMRQAEAVDKEIDKIKRQNNLFSNLPEMNQAAETLSTLAQTYISILGVENYERDKKVYEELERLRIENTKLKGESGCDNPSVSCADSSLYTREP